MKLNAVHTIVLSPCGGTLKAAEAVARGIPLERRVHNHTRPDKRRALSCGPEELVIFGFPVYAGRVPGVAEAVFRNLSGRHTPAVLVAVYGNREFEGALLDLDRLARERGFQPVAASAAVAEHSLDSAVAAGRPDAADAAALADFGRQIYERLLAQPDLEAFPFEAPGAYPEPRPSGGGFRPVADPERCTACGQCVPACPVSAIPEDDPLQTAETCIACAACLKVCPEEARAFPPAQAEPLQAWLRGVTAERKNPQFFF